MFYEKSNIQMKNLRINDVHELSGQPLACTASGLW